MRAGGRVGERRQNDSLDRGAVGFCTGEKWRVKGMEIVMRCW
jgi:hypothetical protein